MVTGQRWLVGPKRRAERRLAKLSARVAEWRERHGGRGARIPDEIWNEAVEVARTDGVYATALAVHFNRGRLQARVLASGQLPGGKPKSTKQRTRIKQKEGDGGRFIALELARPSSTSVLELLSRHGDRMRVEGVSGAELWALIERLWRSSP